MLALYFNTTLSNHHLSTWEEVFFTRYYQLGTQNESHYFSTTNQTSFLSRWQVTIPVNIEFLDKDFSENGATWITRRMYNEWKSHPPDKDKFLLHHSSQRLMSSRFLNINQIIDDYYSSKLALFVVIGLQWECTWTWGEYNVNILNWLHDPRIWATSPHQLSQITYPSYRIHLL